MCKFGYQLGDKRKCIKKEDSCLVRDQESCLVCESGH